MAEGDQVETGRILVVVDADADGDARRSRTAARADGPPMTDPLRIANCSGFYGDRLSAAREMVEGGPIDVLTGDWLAELTMLILWKGHQRDPLQGLGPHLPHPDGRGAGHLRRPGHQGGHQRRRASTRPGWPTRSGPLADRLGLAVSVAHVEGDDLLPRIGELERAGHPLAHLDTGQPLAEASGEVVSANAYLGAWPIVEALRGGADVVICPRITDASLVVGPAAWHHGWSPTDWDRLAGAVVAGHVIECGPQATGGNYAFFTEVAGRRASRASPSPRWPTTARR